MIPDDQAPHLDDQVEKLKLVVLIVEDHEIVRSGIRKVITNVLSDRRVEILESSTFSEACQIIRMLDGNVDMVLLDIKLPDAHGAMGVELLATDWVSLPVVVFSASEDWALALDFLRAGALGFISKNWNMEIITNALRLIFAGERYFPPQVFDLLAKPHVPATPSEKEADEKDDGEHGADGTTRPLISAPRQREVLRLMLLGHSNREIASELGISLGTVKNHVAAILHVHNAPNRKKAIMIALNQRQATEDL